METAPNEDFNDVDYVDVDLAIVGAGGGQFRSDGRPPTMSNAIETGILVRYGLVDAIHGKLTKTDDKFCSIFVFDFQFNPLKSSRSIHRVNIDLVVTSEIDTEVRLVTPTERVSINPRTQNIQWAVGGGLRVGPDIAGAEAKAERTNNREDLGYATALGWPSHSPYTLKADGRLANCAKWVVEENQVSRDGVPARMRAACLLLRDDEDEFKLDLTFNVTADWKTRLEKMWGDTPPQKPLIINPKDVSTSRIIKDYVWENLSLIALEDVWQVSYGTLVGQHQDSLALVGCTDMELLIEGGTDADIVLVSRCWSRNGAPADSTWPEAQETSLIKETGARILSFEYHDAFEKGIIHTRMGLDKVAACLLNALNAHREGSAKAFILAAQNQDQYHETLESTCSIIINVVVEYSDLPRKIFSTFNVTLDMLVGARLDCTIPAHHSFIHSLFGEKTKPLASLQKLITWYSPRNYQMLLQPPVLYPCQDQLADHSIDWEKEIQAVNEWLQTPKTCFLHLINDVCHPTKLLNHLKGDNERNYARKIFYFRFRKEDPSLNNCTALLASLVGQASRKPSSIPKSRRVDALQKARSYNHLSKKELFQHLRGLWAQHKQHQSSVIVVIWNLDGCVDSLSWLVDACTHIETFSESLPLFILQSSGTETITRPLGGSHRITVWDSISPEISGYQHRCKEEVNSLMRVQPSLSPLEEALYTFLNRHQHDNILDVSIAEWVCRYVGSPVTFAGPESIESTLSNLTSISTQELIEEMIARIPSHKLRWAEKIIIWVMNSFRPITIWELRDAMYPDAISSNQNSSLGLEAELKTHLAGLIKVEFNELSFVHPTVHRYLTRQESGSQTWHSAEESHLEIIRDLLGYLARVETTSQHAMPLRQDLKSYAVSFLLPHYLKLKSLNPNCATLLSQKVKCYLASFSITQSLESCQASELESLEPDSTETQGGDDISLKKAAVTFLIRNGRKALTTSDLDELCPRWSKSNEVIEAALMEAVLCCDADLLEALPMPPPHDVNYSAVLESVSLCEDPKIIRLLFEKGKMLEIIPDIFLKQAAYLGIGDIIHPIVEKAVDDDTVDKLPDDLFLDAIVSSKKGVVESLIPAIRKADPKLRFECTKLAYQEGEPDTIDLVLFRELDYTFSEGIDANQEFLNAVCERGNWRAVQKIAICSGPENKNWETGLQTAVKRGFVQCIRQVLRLISPNTCPDSDRQLLWEVLMGAIEGGHIESSREMLEGGVDPNQNEHWRVLPVLSWAVKTESTEMVRLLRNYKVSLEAEDDEGCTPIFLAATLGFIEIMQLLIEEGSNIDARAQTGDTALYKACYFNQPDIVKLLLDHGADVRIATYADNWSPLEVAYDYPEVLRLLVNRDVDYKRLSGGATALWRAALYGHSESVEILLATEQCEVDFYLTDPGDFYDGWTALAVAVAEGHLGVAKLLLEAGADVNYINPTSGVFILQLVKTQGLMALLLEYCPNTSLRDNMGNTALHPYDFDQGVPVMQRLINFNCDVNLPNLRGITPLHFTCLRSSLEAVKLLSKHGASVDALDLQYFSPLAYTCMTDKEQLEKTKYLVEGAGSGRYIFQGKDGVTTLGMAVLRSDRGTVEYLFQHGGKGILNDVDHIGRSPLFHACYREEGALDMVEYLIEQGAKISSHKDVMGRTLLHIAATTHNVELVKRFIQADSKLLDEKDEDGWGPLHWAMREVARPNLNSEYWDAGLVVEDQVAETIIALVDGKQERLSMMAATGYEEWTALKLAKYHGFGELIKSLLLPPATGGRSVDTELHESPVAQRHEWNCDVCFCLMRGLYYKCLHAACLGQYALCFKCIHHKDRVHYVEHGFEEIGPEFESSQDDDAAAESHDLPELQVEEREINSAAWGALLSDDSRVTICIDNTE
ncbi:hypothetical protein F53441_653 [Fusarium austroafricanum]|uniref:Nephrocystin 3-like N-terminal domain-containing protein n=1 Tax=Fusarium austroafricanum TaxID=2364996 RepID=A0A8H4PEB4_9HYPO|nr:hypothetical protein F53441_653 [Fusarium austroafricanum]